MFDTGRTDAERLLWLLEETGIDSINGIDIHEHAAIGAAVFSREEPDKSDYLRAVRRAIDEAITDQRADRQQ